MKWALHGLILMAFALPSTGHGNTGYTLENTRWDGLSRLHATAREAGVTLMAPTALDWGEVGPSDYLVFIHPERPPSRDNARAFLEEGGTLLLADDFGEGRTLAKHFGILLVPPGPETRSLPSWPHPTARPPTDAFLGFNMPRNGLVHLNHPAVVSRGAGMKTHLELSGPDGGILVEKKVGKGTLVVLSDPSLWINAMMTSHPNKQLAANLLRRHCQASRCIVHLILPETRESGVYQPHHGVAGGGRIITRFKQRTQRALEALDSRLKALQEGPAPLLTLLAGLLLVAWPLVRMDRNQGDSMETESIPPMSLATPFHQGWDSADFTLPARGALRRLLRALPAHTRTRTRDPAEHAALARSLAREQAPGQRNSTEIAALHAFRFLPILEESPVPPHAAPRRVTGADFRELCDAIDRVLNANGDST